MNTEVLFSVIIPCYNVEDYLEDCVNSVICQTYRNFEIILVDDGSTDSTPQLCDKMAGLDNRISVYHKENGGLSDARNYGMQHAKGDYFVFVDSDDFISNTAFHDFAGIIGKSHPQVLLTRLTEYYGEGDIVEQDLNMKEFFLKSVSENNVLVWETRYAKATWPAPRKIVAKEFVQKYKLQFLKGFLHEDLHWSTVLLIYATKYDVYTENWYWHRMKRRGSITNTISEKRILDVVKMADMLISSSDLNGCTVVKRKLITSRIMRSVYPILRLYKYLSDAQKEQVIRCCQEHITVFRLAPCWKYKLFSVTAKAAGFGVALELLTKL